MPNQKFRPVLYRVTLQACALAEGSDAPPTQLSVTQRICRFLNALSRKLTAFIRIDHFGNEFIRKELFSKFLRSRKSAELTNK
jgi:hypothetical protein